MDEEVAEAVETIVKESKGFLPVAVGLLAFGAGVGIGYIWGRRKSTEVITLVPRELSPKDDRPRKVVIDELPEKPMTNEEIKQHYADDPKVDVVLLNDQKVETNNVFASTTTEEDVWDIKAEVNKRTPHKPYVIHVDEFINEEMASEDFVQATLTYYVSDDVLCDQEEAIIYNRSDLIGDAMLFGHGSGDPNCVYIRNMERRMEYEVLRDPGYYSVEVQGLELEHDNRAEDLKHSRAPRKFRQE